MSNEYYRFMADPELSWKPYRLEPVSDDHPELGVYESSMYVASPQKGDYLIRSEDGNVYVERPSYLEFFDNVSFGAMPSVDELLSRGIIVEVQEKTVRLDFYLQDKLESLHWEIFEAEKHLDDLEHDMYLRRFGFLTKEAREAKRQYLELKPEIEQMYERFSRLESEYNEKVVMPLTKLIQQHGHGKSRLFQRIADAEIRAQQSQDRKVNSRDPESLGLRISSGSRER